MEIINEYANLINFVLLCAIIGWLFKLNSASRNAMLDKQAALDAVNKIREESLTQQVEILKILENTNFVAKIKSFREFYEEKSLMLNEKMEFIANDLLKATEQKNTAEKKFEFVLSNLNISADDVDNIRNVVRGRLLAENNDYFKIFLHEIRTPLSSIILKSSIIKQKIESGSNENALIMLDDIYSLANRIQFITDMIRSEHIDSIHVIEYSNLYNDIVIPVVNACKGYFSKKYGTNILLNFDEFSKIAKIKKIDTNVIKIITLELIENASRFINDNNDHVEINGYFDKSKNQLIMVVSSNSLEILEKEVSLIFSEGFRGHNAVSMCIAGAGSGLAKVRKMLNMMGLEIELASRINPVAMKIVFHGEI